MGDPDCPHCHGAGYLRRDLPVEHPDFGKLEICTCQADKIQAHIHGRLFQLSQLDELKNLTFATFKPHGRVGIGEREQASIEHAFNQSKLFIQNLQGWLLLRGGYGCGKTHLAAAIANEAVTLGIPTIFLTIPDLLDTLRFTYDAEEVRFEERFHQIRSAPLLVLDDFGTQNTTDWAREKLFQILNYRYINQLPLVLTTNLPLRGLEGRIRSRVADPELVADIHIQAPDYRRPIDDSGQPELSTLHNHEAQTFGTFNLRKNEKLSKVDLQTLDEAFQAAQAFAENPAGWLVLMGPYGSGKTHIAAAIANFRAGYGDPVMFIGVPDLLDHLRSTFNPESFISYDRRFEEIRSAPLLVLDDLGTQATTPWVREKLYQIFNHRYNAALPTVITTANLEKDIDPRLFARMMDRRICEVRKLSAPPFRGTKPRRRAKPSKS